MARTLEQRYRISAGTRAAMARRRAGGWRVGEVPFGYRANGSRLEPCPREQRVIELVVELHHAGLSQRAIAAEVDRQLPGCTRSGGRMRQALVSDLLSRHRDA